MQLSSTIRRPVMALVALGAGAAIALTGCSSDDSGSDTSTSTSAEQSAELTAESAQVILRKAVDPATPEADLDGLVDLKSDATKTALVEIAKNSAKAGYTPEIYTVKSVKVNGETADATVAVKSPHAPSAIDMPFKFVSVDGTWKLSTESVDALASMMTQHGGR